MNKDSPHNLALYESKKNQLITIIKHHPRGTLKIKKKTASNLFRYIIDNKNLNNPITIKDFDNIISIDTQEKILDVEGLVSYEKLVQYTLAHGLLPTVAPELKHITVGGAIVGIGIESTSYKYGFVHDGLLEAEVLLANGTVVLCTPTNEHADLFFGLPNSYGTLGYILRAKIKLYSAAPFVHMKNTKFTNTEFFITKMFESITDSEINFIEGLTISENEHYLMLGKFIEHTENPDDIYKKNIFYKLVKSKKDVYLSTFDYIFRYDPDWFWNIPENSLYNLARKILPRSWRNSGFYKKYLDNKHRLLAYFSINPSLSQNEENLIQDWEVPWKNGRELLSFALRNINIMGKPWVVVPIKPQVKALLYPLSPGEIYFNLGCYSSSKRYRTNDPYYNTKIMDNKCFALGGIKMLYSSTFLSKQQFSELYAGVIYQQLKNKYDPNKILGDLYNKSHARYQHV